MIPSLHPSDVPHEFLKAGRESVGLLIVAALPFLVLLGATLFTYSAFDLGWLTLAFAIGSLFGLLIFVMGFIAVRRSLASLTILFNTWIDRAQHPPAPPEPEAQELPANVPNVSISTTNQANADYRKALDLVVIMVKVKSRLADGQKIKGKPFSYDNCHKEGLFSRWEDWNSVVTLLEAAGIGTNLTEKSGWKIIVDNVKDGNDLLEQHYQRLGYLRVNREWMKK